MQTFVADIQTVGESESTLFEMLTPGDAAVTLSNMGANTANYRFQKYVNGSWTDMGLPGSDLYDALLNGETKVVTIVSDQPQVRLVGNASGGAVLWFSVSRFVVRGNGGKLPILSF